MPSLDIALTLPPRAVPVATLRTWTPWTATQNAHLIGHCEVVFSGGWCVSQIPIFKRNDGTLSAGVPSLPKLDREGRVRLKPDGKRDYTAVITFSTDVARQRWNEAVLQALRNGGIDLAGEGAP